MKTKDDMNSTKPGRKVQLDILLAQAIGSVVRALCKGVAEIIRASKGKLKVEIEWKTDRDGNKVRRIKVEN